MRTRIGALVTVAALTLAACGDGGDADDNSSSSTDGADSDDGASGTTTEPTGPSTTASEPTASSPPLDSKPAPEAYDREATFTWASLVYPSDLSPHVGLFSGGVQPIMAALHDRLVNLDPLTGEMAPMLATSWEASTDATSITFQLREDVTFHDGAPFDAEAVVANVEHAIAMGDENANASAYELIDGATAVDEYTVRYDLNGAFAGGLLELMTQGLGAFVSPATLDNADPAAVAGTGPFMASDISPGQRYEMDAYPDYWDPSAQNFATLDIVIESNEDTILNGIASGEFNAGRLPPAVKTRAEQTAGVQVISELSNTAMVLTLNPELIEGGDNPDVIRAINAAIDRDELGNGALRGECVPTVQPWNQSHPAHNPEYAADFYGNDPALARQLLADAGYPNGIALEIDTYTIPAYIPVAEVLQSQFEEAGIDASIKQLDSSVLVSGFTAEGTLQTFLSRLPFYQPPTNLLRNWWLADGGNNPGGWHDPEIDALYPQIMATTDLDEQNDLLREVSGRLVEAPSSSVVICHEIALWLGSEDTIGLFALPFGYDFRRMGIGAS
ncbi:MAG: hypothetical protein CL424_04180 [Acidimicrobiaceae bacterium]|nr:hypothetical protein [Acidimicrobiaceae bacterium]